MSRNLALEPRTHDCLGKPAQNQAPWQAVFLSENLVPCKVLRLGFLKERFSPSKQRAVSEVWGIPTWRVGAAEEAEF